MPRVTRREFVTAATMGATALGLGGYSFFWGGVRGAAAAPAGLSGAQQRTLAAAAERILPRDQDPGATDLGVPTYIERALHDPGLSPARPWLISIVDGVDAQARKREGKPFAELAAAAQDDLLRAWQKGDEAHRYAFSVLLSLTLEGAFGDPKHGGNVGGRGFAMVGFSPPAIHTHAMPQLRRR